MQNLISFFYISIFFVYFKHMNKRWKPHATLPSKLRLLFGFIVGYIGYKYVLCFLLKCRQYFIKNELKRNKRLYVKP